MCNVRSKIARNDNIADLIIFVRCFFIWKTGCISNVITENFCGKGKEIRVGKTGLNVPKSCVDQFVECQNVGFLRLLHHCGQHSTLAFGSAVVITAAITDSCVGACLYAV